MEKREIKQLIANEVNPYLIGIRNEIKGVNSLALSLANILEEAHALETEHVAFSKLYSISTSSEVDFKKAMREQLSILTPVKGKDYFTQEETALFLNSITPVKGIHYLTDEEMLSIKSELKPVKNKDYFNGKDGYTPKKGIDYLTDEEMQSIVLSVTPRKGVDYFDGKDGAPGKDGNKISAEEIRNKLEGLKGSARLSATSIKGLEELVQKFAKTEVGPTRGFDGSSAASGGGISSVAVDGTSIIGNGLTIPLSISTTLSGLSSVSTASLSVTTMSQSSVLFAGVGGLISQDNTNFVYTTSGGVRVGPSNALITSQNKLSVTANANDYHTMLVVNSNAGSSASADVIWGNDLTGSGDYFDIGLNSSTYSNASFTLLGASDAYIITGPSSNLNDINIATGKVGTAIKFAVGGLLSGNEVVRFNASGISAIGGIFSGSLSVSTTAIQRVYFGDTAGATVFGNAGLSGSATPAMYGLYSTPALGTNLSGAKFNSYAGAGTGSGAGTITTGGFEWYCPVVGASGATQQSYLGQMRLMQSGELLIGNYSGLNTAGGRYKVQIDGIGWGTRNLVLTNGGAGNSVVFGMNGAPINAGSSLDANFQIEHFQGAGTTPRTSFYFGTSGASGGYAEFRAGSGTNSTTVSMAFGATGSAQGFLSIGNGAWATTPGTALLDLGSGTTTYAQLRLRAGVAPTSPNNGDVWFDGTNFNARISGVTKVFVML